MKKIVLALMSVFCVSGLVFGAESKSTMTAASQIEFVSNSSAVSGCNFTCRAIKSSNYKAIITDFDLEQGITYCDVYDESLPAVVALPFDANTYSTDCETFDQEFSKELTVNFKKASSNSIDVKSLTDDSDKPTLSRFLTSVVTLDYKNANDSANSLSGLIKPGATQAREIAVGLGNQVKFGSLKKVNPKEVEQTNSLIDGFNKANIQYFSDLFNGMSTVYKHLQNLLFVVVGGFFLASIGGAKLQRYLENKGESTGQNQPYLHKFFIPLLCVGIFYMPISKSVNSNGEITATTTVIQELIRYFTREANNIADVASSIGANTYINKIRGNVGIVGFNNNAVNIREANKAMYRSLSKRVSTIVSKCTDMYGENTIPLLTSVDMRIIDQKALEGGVFSGDNSYAKMKKMIAEMEMKAKKVDEPITIGACAKAIKIQSQYNVLASAPSKLTSGQTQEIANLANEINTLSQNINNREKTLGWVNTVFTPTSLILFELQDSVNKYAPASAEEKFEEYFKKREEELESKRNDGWYDKIRNWLVGKTNDFIIAPMFEKLPYAMLMPGFNSVYNFFKNEDIKEKWRFLICEIRMGSQSTWGFISNFTNNPLGDGNCIVESQVPMLFGLNTTYFMYSKVIKMIPLVIISTATLLALCSYLITLCKYFYISPFVVAFALTTKRLDKIVNFLVTGITIFFKPVLIVLFVYLTLFLYTIIDEMLIFGALGQFNEVSITSMDLGAIITKSAIISLMKFFGALAGCYIAWKTIITGPDWTFKLIGLDKDADNVIASGLAQKLETKAVMV